MTDYSETEYFRARSEEERELSRRAPDPRVAGAHAEMADRYEQMAAGFSLMGTSASPAN